MYLQISLSMLWDLYQFHAFSLLYFMTNSEAHCKAEIKNPIHYRKNYEDEVVNIFLPPLESQPLQNTPNTVDVRFPYITWIHSWDLLGIKRWFQPCCPVKLHLQANVTRIRNQTWNSKMLWIFHLECLTCNPFWSTTMKSIEAIL